MQSLQLSLKGLTVKTSIDTKLIVHKKILLIFTGVLNHTLCKAGMKTANMTRLSL